MPDRKAFTTRIFGIVVENKVVDEGKVLVSNGIEETEQKRGRGSVLIEGRGRDMVRATGSRQRGKGKTFTGRQFPGHRHCGWDSNGTGNKWHGRVWAK